MSKTQQNLIKNRKNQEQYKNYLTLKNNCKIYHKNNTKLQPHMNPQNILTDNMRQVWLTNQLPALCIIDMRQIIQKPIFFNKIGFHCWHQYQSNPQLIQISYSNQKQIDNVNWVTLAKIRLQLVSGWQHFKLPLINSKNILFLKVIILQNHAQYQDGNQQQNIQQNAYLNQISLGFIQQIQQSRIQQNILMNNNSNQIIRQKTFSDYRKLTSSQKQIKKLLQKVNQLTNQNQQIKKTINHQNIIIDKLQQSLQKLTQTVIRMQKANKIIKHNNLQEKQSRIKNNKKYLKNQRQRQRRLQSKSNQSQINNSIEKKIKNKNHSNSRQSKKQYSNHRNNSIYEQNIFQSKNYKPQSNHQQRSIKGISVQQSANSKKRQVINVNIQNSQNSLSQYEGTNVHSKTYNYKKDTNYIDRNTKDKTYIPMLQKLQQLILLRDQKKNKLRSQKKARQTYNHHDQSQDQNSSSKDYY